MYQLTRLAFLALLLSAFTPIKAQPSKVSTPAQVASVPQSAISVSETAEVTAAKQQIKLLESQLETTREYQGFLLDTVYWALGGVFVVVGLLLGFGWFANFKVYERDKESLRAELLSSTSKISAESTASFAKQSADLEQSISSRIEAATEALMKSLKEATAEAIKPGQVSLAALDKRIFQLELLERKGKMLANPSDNMALTDALSLLDLCRKRAEYELPDIINFMLNKLDNGGKLTASEITRVNAIIDQLPAHYKALTDRLRAKLVASDIF